MIKVTLVKPGLLILTVANIDNQLLENRDRAYFHSGGGHGGGGGESLPSRQGVGGPWHSLQAPEDPPQKKVLSASSEGKVCSLGQGEFSPLQPLEEEVTGESHFFVTHRK